MKKERRKEKRRDIDRVMEKTVELLRELERLSGGEEVDYSESYADLVGMKDWIGRREEDRKLGETLVSTIGSIAANIAQLQEKGKRPRKVRVTKMSGKEGAQLDVQTTIVGWEEARPRVGRNYRLIQEDGGVFSSAPLTKIASGYFQTRNSLYQIEVLEES